MVGQRGFGIGVGEERGERVRAWLGVRAYELLMGLELGVREWGWESY